MKSEIEKVNEFLRRGLEYSENKNKQNKLVTFNYHELRERLQRETFRYMTELEPRPDDVEQLNLDVIECCVHGYLVMMEQIAALNRGIKIEEIHKKLNVIHSTILEN